jgi:hypothetical protein
MTITYSSKSSLKFLIFSFLFFLLPLAWADSHVRIVRVSSISGDVQVDRADGQGFDNGILNMPIVHGGRVWTRNDGRTEIEFEDASTIRLAPNTIINFDDLSLSSSGERITKLTLQDGTAYFDLRRREQDVFEILVGHQTFELLHSSHFRIQSDATGIEIAVFKGDLRMTSATFERVEVRKGETLTLDNSDPDRYFLAKNVDTAPYDDWDKERRDYRDRYAAQAPASSGINYGYADLSYYGGFADIPGCGNCWRPYSASPGWDPFSDGSWIYYPNVGWTFVSAYPWGWTPYRYGQWVFVSGYGYCWRPGHTWHNWTPTPVVVTATRGPVAPAPHPVPLPPSRPTGGNSGVVAVGRGPTTGTGGPVRGFVDDDMPRGPRRLRGDNDDDGFTRGRPGNPTAGTAPVVDQDGSLRHQRGDWAVKGRPNPGPANGPANATVTPAAPVVTPNTDATRPTPAPPTRTIREDDVRNRDHNPNHGPTTMRNSGPPTSPPPTASVPATRAPSPAPASPPVSRPGFAPGPAASGPAGGMRSAGAEHGSKGSSSSRSANPK